MTRRRVAPDPWAPAEIRAAQERIVAAAEALMATIDAAMRMRTAPDLARSARAQAQLHIDSAAQWGMTGLRLSHEARREEPNADGLDHGPGAG